MFLSHITILMQVLLTCSFRAVDLKVAQFSLLLLYLFSEDVKYD